MAAGLLLWRASTKKPLTSITSHLFPKLPSPALFSTLCRKTKHLHSTPTTTPHLPPPAAKKVPFTATAHGATWQDPYRWMSDVGDPDFISYVNEENSYADAFMRDTGEMQRILYSDMVSKMPSIVTTPPERWGPWLYYQCIPEGKEYPVLCRKSAVENKNWLSTVLASFKGGFGAEQVLLDWNEIAEKNGYVHVGTCRVSPDHNFLAYTLDTKGNEQFQLQIKDLRNNSIIFPRAEGVVSLAWAHDSCTLFYTLCDQNQRPHRLMRTEVGARSGNDDVILTEDDTRYCLDITSTKDGKFVTVNSNSRTTSEVYVLNATNPQSELQRFCKRVSGVQYFLEHHSGLFYVLTNAPTSDGKNFSGDGYYLATCGDEDAQSADLKNIIMPGDDICLEDMDIFNGHLILFVNKEGSPSICSIDMPIDFDPEREMEIDDFNPWYFPLPSNMCTVTPGSNHDFRNTVYRAVLSSPVTPDLIVDYDMSRRTFSIVQQEDVTNITRDELNYDKDNKKLLEMSHEKETNVPDNGSPVWKDFSDKYVCEEKEVVSHDGVKIPLTVLFSRSAYRKGQSPGLLHGYGAYGETLDRSWCSDRLSLLDRGWVFAFADVRGGAGADPSWHKSGSGLNKLNSIHDYVSCGKYLINEGLIHKHRLGAHGVSAGGLLVGSAVNMYPELFRAAILKVPFLDVVNTLLDPSLPLTTLDYEEFGNPQNRAFFKYIRSYSPYDNIPHGVCCPSMLVSASFNDSRVGVWEAAKWVAKIRDSACKRCSCEVILQTNITGGHFREGGRFARCRETAFDYAYLIKVMAPTQDLQK
ncbi:hypothetical protein ABFS83_12G088800 [Erythranthe nasuta]